MHDWPVSTYFCESCTYYTPDSDQRHQCNYCGRRSEPSPEVGVSSASTSSNNTATMETSQQDELARLFAAQMNVSQVPFASKIDIHTAIQPLPPRLPTPPVRRSALPIDFASTHYTPTAHLRPEPTAASFPPRSPPPSYQESCMSAEMAHTLRQHSIDPAALSASQINLFQNADYEQKLRLLELWRISPPSYRPDLEGTVPIWHVLTNMDKEEADARLRFEQKMQHLEQPAVVVPHETHHVHVVNTYSPSAAAHTAFHYNDAEPYMVGGYAPRSDPVYAASPGLWNAPVYASAMDNDRMSEMEE